MPVINGVYLKDFTALPSSVTDANIIPIAITGNQIAYRTTVAGIVTDARVTSKLLTGLSVTGSAIAATDTILEAFGKVQNQINSKVSSVGLTMPSAFNVANSPITSAGTLAVTAAGVASQYIRGDGALADFPTNGGGGSSVSYYLNGSVSQGTFVGNTYYEMNKTPVIGTGTDFTIGANGYIAQFITDANDPGSLLIPGGNWNVEMYFSASSSGGTPSFYVEVYKYNGTTFTLLGTSSATPEGITNGTAIDLYYTSVGIPETVLAITDRLAIRVYVTNSGRTIKLHTEDNHLSEIVTTFSNGINTLNGLTKQAQYFAVGSTGTDFAISSSVDTHTFNLPTASATNRGALSSADWTTFNNKQGTITLTTTGTSGAATFVANTLNIPNYADGGILSLSAIGASPNANAATITGTVLNLEPASASFGGVITTGTQTFAGAKTFSSDISVNTTMTVGRGGGGIAFNTALGANALYSNTTGSLNVALGYQAGFGSLGTNANTTGSNNIFIGYNSVGLSATASNRTWIGNAATTSTWLGGRLLIGSTTDSGNAAIQVTATTLLGLYASATTGVGVQGNSSGTGGSGVYGSSGNGYGGVFYNDSTTYPALEVNNNNELAGNIAVFRSVGTSVFIINSLGNISNGTYTYTLPSATGTLALTSALSGYLPLTGGTLTGSLTGTSATFSGNIGVGGGTPSIFTAYSVASFGSLSTTSNGITIASTTTGNGLIEFADGTAAAAYRGYIQYAHTADSLTFGTAGSDRLTIASTGAATFSSGISVGAATATTGGIQFPATQVAIASANNLDDYEEGTWTPGLSFANATTGITYSSQSGTYTKIGRQVTVNGYFSLSNKGSAPGFASITGLPFTIANTNGNYSVPSLRINNITYTGSFMGIAGINTTSIPMEQVSEAGTLTDITNTNFSNSSSIILSFTYFV